MAALLGIGFAAGLPSAYRLLGSTLQAWLGQYNHDIRVIGLASLVTVPIAFNFVWAPILDRYTPPVFAGLGRRRGWLMFLQFLLAVAIAAMAMTGPTSREDAIWPLMVVGVVAAFLVASHDVVADAYRTDVLPDEELGAGAAVYVNGYRLGMLVAGGGALYLAQDWTWRHVYLLLSLLMLVTALATFFAPRSEGSGNGPDSLVEAVIRPFEDFFGRTRWAGLAILAFVVLFKLPDSMANAMTMPLLQTELQFDLKQIAAREWFGSPCVVAGAFVGGWITARIGIRPSLLLFGCLQAASNGGFLLLAFYGKSASLLFIVIAVENICAGMVAAGFIAFLMSLCNRKYSATQYALFTSLMYGTGTVIGAMTGYAVHEIGFVGFYLLSMAMGLPAMVLIAWLPKNALMERASKTHLH